LVTRFPLKGSGLRTLKLTGPLSLISVQDSATNNDLVIAGLGRSVGDFVLEWTLDLNHLNQEVISSLLDPSDSGVELIEGTAIDNSISSFIFYKIVNSLRPASKPVKKSLARVYSRRAVNWILEANRHESQMIVLAAELPYSKRSLALKIDTSQKGKLLERTQEGLTLVSKGSRFGTVVPLLLSGISSLFAVGVAIYALTIYLLFGNAAEGWTSIAVITGFGQGAILALIGLVWSRLDSLAKGLSKRNDLTLNVEVFPAKI